MPPALRRFADAASSVLDDVVAERSDEPRLSQAAGRQPAAMVTWTDVPSVPTPRKKAAPSASSPVATRT